jgi:hypothetical protein
MEWGFITGNDRGQADAALVRRFRQAVAKRDRAAVFDAVVRDHRDAVLARYTERLWPDADAAVTAARDLFIVGYLAMSDPAKLTRPDRLRDWLLGISDHAELLSGLATGINALNWRALEASIEAGVPDMRGSAARRASLRHWLEQIVATLPEPRQQMYDLFVRRALDSRNAARELGTDAAEARRLRRENREAILRAFEVTAFAAAEAAPDPLGGETPGCGYVLQLMADAQRDGGMREGVRPESVVLPADLRLSVTRHVTECFACRDRRDACMARWAPELLPILASAELNEQVIEDLRTIPAPGRSHAGAPATLRLGGNRGTHRGAAAAATRRVNARRAAMAGGGSLAALLVLGFVQPGFLLSPAASAPRGAAFSSSKAPSSGSLSSSGKPQIIGSAEASGRAAPTAIRSSSAGLPPIAGVTATPAPSFVTPTLVPTTVQPSSSPTSSSAEPTPTSASPSPSPSSSSSSRPSPSPSPSTTQPVVSKTPTPTPTPTPTSTTPTPTPSTSTSTPAPSSPAPSTSAASTSPASTSAASSSPASTPAASTSPATSPAPSTSPTS